MFSVLISVYTKEQPEYLQCALFSIWDSQTLKPNQIVIVLDGPLSEELNEIIIKWKNRLDPVVTIVPIKENVGLGAALNIGLTHCKYELVARMDTDDISHPHRFQKQVSFMNDNEDITASSAQTEEWDETLKVKLNQRNLPLKADKIKIFAKRRSPLSHPVTIFRKSDILSVGGYPPLRKAQDYALWSVLLVHEKKLANLPDFLLKMRTGGGLLDRRGWSYFKYELKLLSFQREIGFLPFSYFISNVMLKAGLRLAPKWVKDFLYKVFR